MPCIFCYQSPPQVVLTDEHVFPEAVGGQLVLTSVCKRCNDKLGSCVDVLLTEEFLIRMIRLGLRIPSKSGSIQSPLRNGAIKSHPELIGSYIQPTMDGRAEVRLRPAVKRGVDERGQRVAWVSGEPSQVAGIIDTLRARAKRDGQGLRVVRTTRKTIQKPVVTKTVHVQPVHLMRPLLKIAYELGVFWLGAKYASHINAVPIAEVIRTGTIRDVEAQIGYFPPSSTFEHWGLPSTHHAAFLDLMDGEILVAVRLFNVIEARVLLVENRVDFPLAVPRWLVIDPVRRLLHQGEGRRSVAIASEDGTDVLVSRVDANHYRVAVTYRGELTTRADLELTTTDVARR